MTSTWRTAGLASEPGSVRHDMTMRPSRILAMTAAVAAAAALLLGAVAPAEAATKSQRIELRGDFTSKGTTLATLPGGITYGWNHLVAGTRWAGQDATIDFLGDVSYVNGSGPFNGYITVTRADGATLGLRVQGSALSLATTGTADARFSGNVTVIGGAGAYDGATGIGTMTGTRQAALGSPVQLTLRLTVVP